MGKEEGPEINSKEIASKCIISRDLLHFTCTTYRHTQRELPPGFPFLAHREVQEENQKNKQYYYTCFLSAQPLFRRPHRLEQ